MKIIGLIVEYNPFHNGHLYHLQEAKKITNADVIIAVTSTYFSMRGEVCAIDKRQKCAVALSAGIDIMVELPYLLGCQNADIFAENAVRILAKMGVNTIVSGSEINDLAYIKKVYNISQEKAFQTNIKNHLDQGYSYRKSFSLSLEDFHLPDLKANDLLNLKYYESIIKNDLDIELKLIKRIHNDYHDDGFNTSHIQSATAIRKQQIYEGYVPEFAYNIYKERPFMQLDDFTAIYNHLIVINDLKTIFEAKEGIENKLINTTSLTKLIQHLTSKRYTASRITRFISYVITNTTIQDFEFDENYPIRVLGFNQTGQTYLNQIKKQVNYFTRLINGIHPVYDFEIKLAKIFSNVYHEDFIKLEQSLPYRK